MRLIDNVKSLYDNRNEMFQNFSYHFKVVIKSTYEYKDVEVWGTSMLASKTFLEDTLGNCFIIMEQ